MLSVEETLTVEPHSPATSSFLLLLLFLLNKDSHRSCVVLCESLFLEAGLSLCGTVVYAG